MTVQNPDELSGHALDQAVSDIEGGPFRAYSTDEAAAQVIIDREDIELTEFTEPNPAYVFRWIAEVRALGGIIGTFGGGQTRLEAAMRARIKQHRYDSAPANTPNIPHAQ